MRVVSDDNSYGKFRSSQGRLLPIDGVLVRCGHTHLGLLTRAFTYLQQVDQCGQRLQLPRVLDKS